MARGIAAVKGAKTEADFKEARLEFDRLWATYDSLKEQP